MTTVATSSSTRTDARLQHRPPGAVGSYRVALFAVVVAAVLLLAGLLPPLSQPHRGGQLVSQLLRDNGRAVAIHSPSASIQPDFTAVPPPKLSAYPQSSGVILAQPLVLAPVFAPYVVAAGTSRLSSAHPAQTHHLAGILRAARVNRTPRGFVPRGPPGSIRR